MRILRGIIVISVMMLVYVASTGNITTVHAEPETTVEVTEVTTVTEEASAESEVIYTYQCYIIVLLAAIVGALVSIGFWHILGA